MKNLLLELGVQLKLNEFVSANYLQEGVSKPYIEKLLLQNGLDLDFPKELFDLYEWHNGQSHIYEVKNSVLEIFWYKLFYPIEEAIDIYKSQLEYLGDYNFPIFGNVDTSHDIIDLSKKSKNYLFIMRYDDEKDLLRKYPSLEKAIAANLECYKSKAYLPDEKGLLSYNKSVCIKIHKEYGRGCEYWD